MQFLFEDQSEEIDDDYENIQTSTPADLDVLVDGIKNVPPYIDILIIISIALLLWFILVVFN